MKILESVLRTFEFRPVYEFGSLEPVGYVDMCRLVSEEEVWKCSFCGSRVSENETRCPDCGVEY